MRGDYEPQCVYSILTHTKKVLLQLTLRLYLWLVFHSRVVVKHDCALESPGVLVKRECWAHVQSFWLSRSRVWPENLYFWQVPLQCYCYKPRNHTSKTIALIESITDSFPMASEGGSGSCKTFLWNFNNDGEGDINVEGSQICYTPLSFL